MAITRSCGQLASNAEMLGAASRICSRLSSRSSILFSTMCSAKPSLAPIVWAIVGSNSWGSATDASGTQKTPSSNSPTSSAAT